MPFMPHVVKFRDDRIETFVLLEKNGVKFKLSASVAEAVAKGC